MRGRPYLVGWLILAGALLAPAPAAPAAGPDPAQAVGHVRQGRYLTARTQLLKLLFSDADIAWKRRALYMLGHVDLKLAEPDEAAGYFERARRELPAVADYALYNLGLSLKEAGRHDEARRAFTALLEGDPSTRLKPHATLQRAEAAFAQGAWAEARADCERLLKAWPSFDDAPLARLRLGQIEEAKGEEERALEHYRAAVLGSPAHPAASEAAGRLAALKAPPWTAPEALRLGLGWLAAGRAREALETLDSARRRTRAGMLRGRLDIASAKAALAFGKRQEAVSRLERLVEKDPRHPDTPEALYLAGRALWNLNRQEEARTLLRRLLNSYRSSPFREQAFYILGRIYAEQGSYARSQKAYRELAAAYPSSELAREGLWRTGWNDYRRGDFRSAEEAFRRGMQELASTDWEDEMAYWLARTLERSGRAVEAREMYIDLVKRYPHTYYGQRAAWRMEALGAGADHGRPVLEPGQAREGAYALDSLVGEGEARRLDKALELAAMGFDADARSELALVEAVVLASGAPPREAAFALGAHYHGAGLYELAIRQLNGPFASMRPEEVAKLDRRFWELYYPRPYRDEVERASAANGLEPHMVWGLMRQESAFDTWAVSPAGAVGLMQLLPRGAEAAPGGLFDPEVNAARGSAHLARLIERYQGRMVDVLVAYNAGERRLKQWRERFRGMEEDEFVEAIPFTETRTYVKRVLRNAFIYRILYPRQ